MLKKVALIICCMSLVASLSQAASPKSKAAGKGSKKAGRAKKKKMGKKGRAKVNKADQAKNNLLKKLKLTSSEQKVYQAVAATGQLAWLKTLPKLRKDRAHAKKQEAERTRKEKVRKQKEEAARKKKELEQKRKKGKKRGKLQKVKHKTAAALHLKKIAHNKKQFPALKIQPGRKSINVKSAAQSGAACGYYALYNGWAGYNELTGALIPQFAYDEWRRIIINRRASGLGAVDEEEGQWLDDSEVAYLAETQMQLDPAHYTIIPDILDLSEQPQLLTDEIVKVLQDIRKNSDFTHSFILGSMQHNVRGAYGGSRGHWIAIILAKRGGRLHNFVLDSLNGFPKNMIVAFEHLIEKVNPLKRRVVEGLDRTIAQARRAYLSYNVNEMLLLLTNYISQAQAADMLNKTTFQQQVGKITEMLNAVRITGTPEQQKAAAELLKRIR